MRSPCFIPVLEQINIYCFTMKKEPQSFQVAAGGRGRVCTGEQIDCRCRLCYNSVITCRLINTAQIEKPRAEAEVKVALFLTQPYLKWLLPVSNRNAFAFVWGLQWKDKKGRLSKAVMRSKP